MVSAYLLTHVSPFKEIAAERGMAAASEAMVGLLKASPVLTLGGQPQEGAHGGYSPPGERRTGGAGGKEKEGEEGSATVVYRKGRVYVNCTVRGAARRGVG